MPSSNTWTRLPELSWMHGSTTFPDALVFLCIIVGREITSHLVGAYLRHLSQKEGYIKILMAFGSQMHSSTLQLYHPKQGLVLCYSSMGGIYSAKERHHHIINIRFWWLLISCRSFGHILMEDDFSSRISLSAASFPERKPRPDPLLLV